MIAGVALLVSGVATASASTATTVKSGDTLWDISRTFNVSLTDLETANGLNDNSVLSIGQNLIIPNDTATALSSTSQVSQPTASQQTTNSSNNASANTTNNTVNTQTTTTTSDDSSAKAWIAARESSNSYTASNGQYYGKYQLSVSYLNGDYSAANQERVADQYVASRYGSWDAAKAFWQANGWY